MAAMEAALREDTYGEADRISGRLHALPEAAANELIGPRLKGKETARATNGLEV